MKRGLQTALLFSLTTNIGLIAVLIHGNQSTREWLYSFLRADSFRSGPSVAGVGRTMRDSGHGMTLMSAVWKQLLSSNDLKTTATDLRAEGCPEAMVRAIIAVLLDQEFSKRRRMVLNDGTKIPYWQAPSTACVLTASELAALRCLDRDEKSALQEALGPDSPTASDVASCLARRAYDKIAIDKIDLARQINLDYRILRTQIVTDANGGPLPWEKEKMAELNNAERNELAALLTPGELRQYDLYNSSTAERLRNESRGLMPTEKEFLAIYDAQTAYDQRYDPFTATSSVNLDNNGTRMADHDKLVARIKNELGDARYADYLRATDRTYQITCRLVGALRLPAENAQAVWQLRREITKRAAAVRAELKAILDPRAGTWAALADEANHGLARLLTPDGATVYKQTVAGKWVQMLESAAKTPPRTVLIPPSTPAIAPGDDKPL